MINDHILRLLDVVMIIKMRLIETLISVVVLWVLVESNGSDMVVRRRRMNLMMMRVVVVMIVRNWWRWTSEGVCDASLHLEP